MTYFKINEYDFSQYVNKLEIQTKHMYNAKTNANGDTAVKYIASKKVITVGIIPLDESSLKSLVREINKFQVSISYRDPETGSINSTTCIIPTNNIAYYTIRADKVQTKAFNLAFEEL